MRITGGRARGRVIPGRVRDGVRPTSSRVREALFSVLGQDLSGQRVLDAFGGSGLLGLEAWSRGAEVVAVEQRRAVADVLLRSAQALGATGQGWSMVVGDVGRRVGALGTFDGVLADPPYADDPSRWLEVLGPAATRWLVYEAPAAARLPSRVGDLALDRPRPFGNTTLWIYQAEDEA